jgi:hypothetical protein
MTPYTSGVTKSYSYFYFYKTICKIINFYFIL